MKAKDNQWQNRFREFKYYFWITVGTFLLTVGVYFFKIPNGFVTGGVSGIGTILGRLSNILSSGQWIMIINIVLLGLGFIFLGKMNGIRTVYCSLLFSFMTYSKIMSIFSPIDTACTNLIFILHLDLTAFNHLQMKDHYYFPSSVPLLMDTQTVNQNHSNFKEAAENISVNIMSPWQVFLSGNSCKWEFWVHFDLPTKLL